MPSCRKLQRTRETTPCLFRVLALFLLICPISFSSCAGHPDRPDPSTQRPLQSATLDQLVSLMQEQETAIQTLKGLFRAQVQGPGIPASQQVEGAVFFRRPDNLRLQGFNRLGMKLFELALDEGRYRLRTINGKLLTGQVAELHQVETIARPFKLSVLAMSGVVGTPPPRAGERVVLSEEDDRYRLDVFASDGTGEGQGPYRKIWFDRRLLQVTREDRISGRGDVEATVEFDDFRAVPAQGDSPSVTGFSPDVMKPFRVRAQDGEGRSRLQLVFHEITANVPVKPEELQVTRTISSHRVPSRT
jgi:hypothetical protein